ncbi:hypothetical protein SAMN02799624_05265 [Paenibacillus sp. UNC496MF]|uniref:hypothetical protein n=1 Tax=Paenibacillus sp. UNC496MF TaxID=1502753 RepID=UPI0008E41BFA|nr:hypothetical protein [Paenibacillus sp. UNC496MF]SFJ63166.1 hypothetical protein SAMN02799624_05265 [Paenibacillus sp. UNC496MF]
MSEQGTGGVMSARLSQEFRQDPLFKLILKTDLTDELFDDYIEAMKEAVDYTTSEFEEWYCTQEQAPNFLCKPSTMRSWQKQLNHYIEARMSGRTVLMDYQAVFRLKMALLLRKSQNIKLSRCAELVGIVSSDQIRVFERDEIDDDRRPSREGGLVDPFSNASEDQMRMLSEFIAQVVDKRMDEKMQLLLPGEDRIEEINEKIESIAGALTALQENVTDDKQRELIEQAVSTMRQDVDTRDKVILEQLKELKDDKQAKLEMQQEMKQEIVKSLPWFVRMFVKKDK